MPARKLAALRDAAETGSGVTFDGLRARRDADGYALATPDAEWTGLTRRAFLARAATYPLRVHDWFHWTREVGGGDPRADADADGGPDADADADADGDEDPVGGGAGDAGARRAFLRWIEAADERAAPDRYRELVRSGVSRAWGQLRLRVTLDAEGERRYDVRHVDDADAAVDDLDAHRDPAAAREFTKYDADGDYRPLRTAPTLPRGWVYPDLDGREAVAVVDAVYPATVANWHREREGRLDVTHWDETAERQTGIYDLVDELDEAAVNRIAEACCVDSQCLKRREWDKNEETELAPPRGDGEFPCREPCSVVIAAARTWTKLEREESRTYEFDLTPSEKAQIEEIVDAVAEGRTDEIREADVTEGANRYRARYLRAKRFDDGTLPEASAEGGDGDADGHGRREADADGGR